MDNAIEYLQCRLSVMNIPRGLLGVPVIQLMEEGLPRKEIESVNWFIRKWLNRSETLQSKLITLSWTDLRNIVAVSIISIDIITSKNFPHNGPFRKGIYWSP